MIISIIVAMDERGGIGLQGKLPWRLAADLKRFKTLTLGHHVLMGRKTFESIGNPLSGRINLVLSHGQSRENSHSNEVYWMHSVEEAIRFAESRGENELFIIGGAQVYAECLPLASRIYVTLVHATVPADAFFPQVDWHQWRITEVVYQEADDNNDYTFTYQLLERDV